MIHYVFGTRISCRSGISLAVAIGAVQGKRCRYYQADSSRKPRFPHRRHVRYGGLAEVSDGDCLNKSAAVSLAGDKKTAMVTMGVKGVSVPDFYEIEDAPCGTNLIFRNSHRHGANDEPYIVRHHEEIDRNLAANYDYCMKYILKRQEYRAHVVCGQVVKVQRKRRRRGVYVDPTVRNLANGWVFCNEPMWPQQHKEIAIAAVSSLGLDFGAVDCATNKLGKLFVFEVNTAPGLQGSTLEAYATAFTDWDNSCLPWRTTSEDWRSGS